MGLNIIKDTAAYWNGKHLPFTYIAEYRYWQIKRYFHVCLPGPPADSTKGKWIHKLSPLIEYLQARFKDFVLPPHNVSIDEMIAAYYGKFLLLSDV